MGAGAAGGDQLVSDALGESQVCDPVAVKMPELPAPKPELDPAEAMRPDLDSFPGAHCVSNPIRGAGRLLSHELAQARSPASSVERYDGRVRKRSGLPSGERIDWP